MESQIEIKIRIKVKGVGQSLPLSEVEGSVRPTQTGSVDCVARGWGSQVGL